MNYIQHMNNFFAYAKRDKRLTPAHIALYMALFQYWNFNRFKSPFAIYREDVMQLSRIGSKNTYHKCLKELHAFKYIFYQAAVCRYKPPYLTMIVLGKTEDHDQQQLDLFAVKNVEAVSPNFDTDAGLKNGTDSTEYGTDASPKNETDCVPYLTLASPIFETGTVPKMGHLIKLNINNTIERDSIAKKIFKKNEKIQEGINALARVPFLGPVNEPPCLNDVENFFRESKYPEQEGKKFYNHYKAIGWKLSGNPVEDWRALANKWMLNHKNFNTQKNETKQQHNSGTDTDYSQPL